MLSGSSIRYLLAIYQLSDGGAAVRSVDLANLLGITRASVVKNLKKLTDNGLVCKKHYGSIRLTAPGIQETNRVFYRIHAAIRLFYPLSGPFAGAVPPGRTCCGLCRFKRRA